MQLPPLPEIAYEILYLSNMDSSDNSGTYFVAGSKVAANFENLCRTGDKRSHADAFDFCNSSSLVTQPVPGGKGNLLEIGFHIQGILQ